MTALAVLVAAAAGTGVATARAAAKPKGSVELEPSNDRVAPTVLVDRAGAVTVAYVSGETLVVEQRSADARNRPGDGFERIPVAGLPASQITGLDLVLDPVGLRQLLFVGVSLPALGVWVVDLSAKQASARQIWDSFAVTGSASVRPTDGSIGLVPGQTNIERLIVPANLEPERHEAHFTKPDLEYDLTLSDDIVSRTEVDHVFGPDGRSYTLAEAPTGGFLHVGGTASANGSDRGPSRPVTAPKGVVWKSPDLAIASGRQGAGLLAVDRFGDNTMWFAPVSANGVGTWTRLPFVKPSKEYAFPRLLTSPDGTFFVAARARGVGTVLLRRADDGTWTERVVVGTSDGGETTPITAYAGWSVGGRSGTVGAMAFHHGGGAYVLSFTARTIAPKKLPSKPTKPASR